MADDSLSEAGNIGVIVAILGDTAVVLNECRLDELESKAADAEELLPGSDIKALKIDENRLDEILTSQELVNKEFIN